MWAASAVDHLLGCGPLYAASPRYTSFRCGLSAAIGAGGKRCNSVALVDSLL